MKQTALLLALLLTAFGAAAQPGRIFRTEVLPYAVRSDAEKGAEASSGHALSFSPATIASSSDVEIVGEQVEIPFAWTDGCVYLHLEAVGSAYSLWINDRPLADVEDGTTPAEFEITECLREGTNDFKLLLRRSAVPQIERRAELRGPRFAGSRIYFQNSRSIADFEVALVPDSTERFGVLELDIIARNAYNYPETVTVGYDIYSPEGKLMDFNIREVRVDGRSTDTVRFAPYVYHTYEHRWEATGKEQPLYRVMLFTRRDGAYKEYMPFRVGFGRTELRDGRLVRLGKELRLAKAEYAAAADAAATRRDLIRLRSEGKNTICPPAPQPAWFYALCDELGLYVIDCVAIDAPRARDDRRVGGTPSNDPALLGAYLERVKAMYYRSRNFTCVIGFSLGRPSGNGYNMYKAYEWLKSVEKYRPVVYEDAAGEWNSDL